jgi:hypothetical protein
VATEAFMTIGTMITVVGWSIVLIKRLPFAFSVFYLSNQELKTMVLKHLPRMGLKHGRMALVFLVAMLVNMTVLIIRLDNIIWLSKIRGKIFHMCLFGVLIVNKKNTKLVS